MGENIDQEILDMFNTKYIIQRNPTNGQFEKVDRYTNLGNAWFISDYQLVNNADEEMKAIGEFNPTSEVIIDKRFNEYIENINFQVDTLSSIELVEYAPNKLVYNYSSSESQIAVFSDFYYDKGWNAYLNGEKVPYFRANYILRSLVVPPGEGSILFEFKPKSYFIGGKISLIGSIILVLLSIGIIAQETGLIRKIVKK